ncbi:MAG TPA: hypothetical protein VMM17_10870 [Gemmatimonadaceae bacterium]|nr:hypothetical protein [Gemmatimonadaceae bacterium]
MAGWVVISAVLAGLTNRRNPFASRFYDFAATPRVHFAAELLGNLCMRNRVAGVECQRHELRREVFTHPIRSPGGCCVEISTSALREGYRQGY